MLPTLGRIALVPLLLAALAGCDALGSDADVRVSADRTTYAPGATVRVRVENAGPRPLYFGACSLRLERREGSRWVDVNEVAVCADVLLSLDAGATTEGPIILRGDLPDGTYRLAFHYGVDDDAPIEEELATTTIRVED